jgi:hypothetical protein
VQEGTGGQPCRFAYEIIRSADLRSAISNDEYIFIVATGIE